MTAWPKDAKEFAVSVIRNKDRRTSYSYIPKPIVIRLSGQSCPNLEKNLGIMAVHTQVPLEPRQRFCETRRDFVPRRIADLSTYIMAVS